MKHFMQRHRRWLWLAAALLLLAAFYHWPDTETERYQTTRVDYGDLSESVTANGQLNPVKLISVGTQVSGIVRSYSADFNDRVSAGQILMRLDDSLLKAQLTQSRANLDSALAAQELAQSSWTRIAPLAKAGYVSSQELDTSRHGVQVASAQVTEARAQVRRDQVNLDYAIIRSPVSGVVVQRAVDVGQTVAASFQTPELYKIAKDMREMIIDAYFSESDIGLIKVGQPALFRVDAYPEKTFSGTVKQIRLNPKTEQNIVTYDVVISVRNDDEKLLPGMTAYVSLETRVHKQVLRVPTAALRFKPPADALRLNTLAPASPAKGRGTVWLLQKNGLKAVAITLGLSDRHYTEVSAGELKADDLVITGLAGRDDADTHTVQFKVGA